MLFFLFLPIKPPGKTPFDGTTAPKANCQAALHCAELPWLKRIVGKPNKYTYRHKHIYIICINIHNRNAARKQSNANKDHYQMQLKPVWISKRTVSASKTARFRA